MGHYDEQREAWDDESLRNIHSIRAPYRNPLDYSGKYVDTYALESLFEKQRVGLMHKRNEGRSGWNVKEDCSQQHLSNLLHKAVEKGDPVSVANYCAFLSARSEVILPKEVQ